MFVLQKIRDKVDSGEASEASEVVGTPKLIEQKVDIMDASELGVPIQKTKSSEAHSIDGLSKDELREMQWKYFLRYDLDDSKTINNKEELSQLTTNLTIKLDINIKLEELENLVEHCTLNSEEELDWDFEEFKVWFDRNLLGNSRFISG